MACKKGAQGAKVFRNAQVISKHIKNQKKIMQYLNTSEACYGSGTPWALSPNYHASNFCKFTKFRSAHLLHKQFINENKARRVRKKGA